MKLTLEGFMAFLNDTKAMQVTGEVPNAINVRQRGKGYVELYKEYKYDDMRHLLSSDGFLVKPLSNSVPIGDKIEVCFYEQTSITNKSLQSKTIFSVEPHDDYLTILKRQVSE